MAHLQSRTLEDLATSRQHAFRSAAQKNFATASELCLSQQCYFLHSSRIILIVTETPCASIRLIQEQNLTTTMELCLHQLITETKIQCPKVVIQFTINRCLLTCFMTLELRWSGLDQLFDGLYLVRLFLNVLLANYVMHRPMLCVCRFLINCIKYQ